MWHERLLNKKFVIGVNIAYIPVSILLIGLGFADFSIFCCLRTLPFIRGITACGVVLFFLSILGITSFVKRFAKLQNCYTFLLLLLSITQLSISCACFSGTHEKMEEIACYGWGRDNTKAPYDSIHKLEKKFQCCGYDEEDARRDPGVSDPAMLAERLWCLSYVDSCRVKKFASYFGSMDSQSFSETPNNPFLKLSIFSENEASGDLTCPTCQEPVTNQYKKISCMVGGIGLLFALTEFGGCFITFTFLKNERRRTVGSQMFSTSLNSEIKY